MTPKAGAIAAHALCPTMCCMQSAVTNCLSAPFLPSDVVDELKSSGVAELSDGATCVFVEGQDIPLIVQKTDGGYGYASTDMAAIKQRIQDEKADWIIYVTDIGQATHFDMVFAAARRAGWMPPKGSTEVWQGNGLGAHTTAAGALDPRCGVTTAVPQ